MRKIISLHDVLEPLKQALLASHDVIISSQICASNLQKVFTLSDGCWLPRKPGNRKFHFRSPKIPPSTNRGKNSWRINFCANTCGACIRTRANTRFFLFEELFPEYCGKFLGEFIRCEYMPRLCSHPCEYRNIFLVNYLCIGFVPGGTFLDPRLGTHLNGLFGACNPPLHIGVPRGRGN